VKRTKRGDELVGAIALFPGAVGPLAPPLERIAAIGRTEDGAAEVGDAAHLGRSEGNDFIVAEQAVEPTADADALPPPVDGCEDGSPMTALRPGASPPPVEMAIFTACRTSLV